MEWISQVQCIAFNSLQISSRFRRIFIWHTSKAKLRWSFILDFDLFLPTPWTFFWNKILIIALTTHQLNQGSSAWPFWLFSPKMLWPIRWVWLKKLQMATDVLYFHPPNTPNPNKKTRKSTKNQNNHNSTPHIGRWGEQVIHNPSV